MQYRKRTKNTGHIKRPNAREYKRIQQLIHAGRVDQALDALNTRAGQTDVEPDEKGLLLTCLGELEESRRNSEEALTIYRKAIAQYEEAGNCRDWLRPALAEARLSIRSNQVPRAFDAIAEIWNTSRRHVEAYNRAIQELPRSLERNGRSIIGPRPVRPSVVLYKLGSMLEKEGLVGDAKYLYEQAVLTTPNGASRARQALSRLAYNRGAFEEAEQYARESILMGKYQAKTVASWPLFIKARCRQQKEGLDPTVMNGLRLHGRNDVKSRTFWMICRTLREMGHAQWKDMAREWISVHRAEDPVITVEMIKLLLADEKIEAQHPKRIVRLAAQVFLHPLSGPKEMIGAGKDITRYRLAYSETPPDVKAMYRRIKQKHGKDASFELMHGVALSAMKAKRHDIARLWLVDINRKAGTDSAHWGKAQMALGHMERVVDQYAGALQAWMRYLSNENMPEHFRMYAALQALKDRRRVSEEEALKWNANRIFTFLENKLSSIEDHEQLLDLARHAKLAGRDVSALADRFYAKGLHLALEALENESNPANSLNILLHLTRRQYHDFQQYRQTIQTYSQRGKRMGEELPLPKSTAWWEYLSIVAGAFFDSDLEEQSMAMIDAAFAAPGIIPEGATYLLRMQLKIYEQKRNYRRVLETAQQLVTTCPMHSNAAHGHYWLGLKQYMAGNESEALQSLIALRRCFAGRANFYWQKQIDIRALLLIGRMNNTISPWPYNETFIEKEQRTLNSHVEHLKVIR